MAASDMFCSYLPVNPLDDPTLSGVRGKKARVKQVKREQAEKAALAAGEALPSSSSPPKFAPISEISEEDIVYTQPTRFWMDRYSRSRSIKIKDLTLTVQTPKGVRTLLEGALLDLKEGARYGFVGPNGSGKTTLLRRIAMGAVINWPTHMSSAYISQHLIGSEKTPFQLLLEATPQRSHLLEVEEQLLARLEDAGLADAQVEALGEQLDEVQNQLAALEGHQVEANAHRILDELQFSAAQRQEASERLSGGWRVRLALGRAMMFKPDVLMLDEPTNHLDFESIQWLAGQLTGGGFAQQIMVVVSHDRAFLDAVTDHTMILQGERLHYFPGSYQSWVLRTSELVERERHLFQAQEQKRAHIEKSIKHLKDHEKSHKLGDKAGGQIASRKKALDRLGVGKTESGKRWKWGTMGDRRQAQEIPVPPLVRPYRFHPRPDARLTASDALLHVENLSFGYDRNPANRLFERVTLTITPSTRLCVLAPNGRGKTTLLSVLVGELKPSTGTIKAHPLATIGYYPQFLSSAEMDMSPKDFVSTYAPRRGSERSPIVKAPPASPVDEPTALKALGRFGISGVRAHSPMTTLSGGEVARTKWAAISLLNPDLIIADEASNHMDMQSIEALEKGLHAFQGAIVIISHDLRLLNAIAAERYVLRRKLLVAYPGSVEDYQQESSAMQSRRLRRLMQSKV